MRLLHRKRLVDAVENAISAISHGESFSDKEKGELVNELVLVHNCIISGCSLYDYFDDDEDRK